MYVYVCKDSFEYMICGIFQAWQKALLVGHENVRLEKEGFSQIELFDEYITVSYDEVQYDRLVSSIKKKISNKAYYYIYYASLSDKSNSFDVVYRFLIKGFKVGPNITEIFAESTVADLLDIVKKVKNDAGFFREIARFNSINGQVYVCHLEPKSNVVHLVAEHFADRMPSINWMIIDDRRRIAVIHNKDEEFYLRELSEEEAGQLSNSEYYNDEYTDMWKSFFNAISIKERENYSCQLNHFAKWTRKHATEFL